MRGATKLWVYRQKGCECCDLFWPGKLACNAKEVWKFCLRSCVHNYFATCRVMACDCQRWPAASIRHLEHAWSSMWQKLKGSPHPWKIAKGPVQAFQAYLYELGWDAPQYNVWSQGQEEHTLHYDCPDLRYELKDLIWEDMMRHRFRRIGAVTWWRRS